MIIVGVLLVIFIGVYFALSLNGQLKKLLGDRDDHKQRCFGSIGRPRSTAEPKQVASPFVISSQPRAVISLIAATGIPKRFAIR